MARPGVMLYFDIIPALDTLPPETVGRLLLGALHYARDGVEPSGDDPALLFAWAFLKSGIDRDGDAYEEKRLRGEWLVYCRGCKKEGTDPLPFNEWKRTVNDTLRTVDVPLPTTTPTTTPTTNKGADKPPAPPPPFGPELTTAFNDWLLYKAERKERYKPKGLQSLVTQIEKQAAVYGEAAVAGLIVESMGNGWKGIIWDRLEKQNPQNRGGGNIFMDMLREEEQGRGPC